MRGKKKIRGGLIDFLNKHPFPLSRSTSKLDSFYNEVFKSTGNAKNKSMFLLIPDNIPDNEVEEYALKRMNEIIKSFSRKKQS